ncbi:alkaline phosphatase family protein [Echinicola jeungdonensis]|uniref:Alkaline phosphatase PafA n=1 Tax=Echinicola jeungdonensis TaxID=709343 RepID=A0ABV5J1U0_9BACT|nr:alkaline phosphatase PafA [Echinicola jeungdonensis]MDN3668949.1 alkaline phosphatase family protein [Echinicola jeungdonensis]
MRKSLSVVLLLFINSTLLFAQQQEKPKLVIGIVVDQMRQEYLFKYYDRFVDGGFKRLMQEGYMMKNAHYNYIPTYTGPGHSSIYTGTTPANHGIIANNWYSKKLGKTIYCASDSTVSAVGGTEENGKISPRNLLTTTITDELMLSTNKSSKVVGIAIKDRGAALPAGHMGQAYWLDKETGEFMTSNYYREKLPEWLIQFNQQKLPSKYLSKQWETLFPVATYRQSISDINDFEAPFNGKETTDFPYNLSELQDKNGGIGLIAATPFGNTLTLDMTYATLEGENLGNGESTDFLALSFSSTDYVGHRFGPSSVELEDTYLRLDRDLEKFFTYLDENYGKDNYLLFLTADHGVADIVGYMESENIPSGSFNSRFAQTQLKGFVQNHYGEGNWILNISNEQIFLNRPLIREKEMDLKKIQREVADFVLRFEGVKETYTASEMKKMEYTFGRKHLLQMGFNHKSSGDILIALEPAWLSNSYRGTSHGSGYTYDTHVPILFYGWKVKNGHSARYCTITDIAPTLSMLLNIRLPNGATGQPILEVLD